MYVHVCQEWDLMKEQSKQAEPKIEKNQPYVRPIFGIRFQEARIKKRMTIVDLANAINVSAKTVSMFENGSEAPSSELSQRIVEILSM